MPKKIESKKAAGLKIHLKADVIYLTPRKNYTGTANIDFRFYFKPDKTLDLNKMVDDTFGQALEQLGPMMWNGAVARHVFKTKHGNHVLELQTTITSVLDKHSLAGKPTMNSEGCLVIPLQMAACNYQFDLTVPFDQSGNIVTDSIPEQFEAAYQTVLAECDPVDGVLTAKQKSQIKNKSKKWVEGIMKEAGIVFPRAEVDLESGVLHAEHISIIVKSISDRVDLYELKLPVDNRGELDLSSIASLARWIANDWYIRMGVQPADWLIQKVKADMEQVASAYANGVIETERKERQVIWDGFVVELKRRDQEAARLTAELDKAMAEMQDPSKIVAMKNALRELSGEKPLYEFKYDPNEYSNQLFATIAKIYKGLNSLSPSVYKGASALEDAGSHMAKVGKGLEFAVSAVGIVLPEVAWIVAKDVFWACFSTLGIKLAKKVKKAIEISPLLYAMPKLSRKAQNTISRTHKCATYMSELSPAQEVAIGKFITAARLLTYASDTKEVAVRISNKLLEAKKRIDG